MRGFFALVEQGLTVVRSAELAASLEAEELAALRSAGIVRASSPPGTSKHDAREEISVPDLVRALRSIWAVDPRGLSTPGKLDGDSTTIGWSGSGPVEREVVLVGRQRHSLFGVLHRSRRTLALLPVARWLADADRAKHGPSALVAVEVLEEVLVARDGQLAHKGAESAAAPASAEPPPAAPRAPLRSSRPAPLHVPGAKRWNEVTISLVDERTVRIDVGGRSHRRTHTDLGMGHGQSREPTKVWEMLVALCEGNGYLSTSRFGGPVATKTLVSRLRGALRAVFGLTQDPLHRYSSEQGWRTRFVASARPPRSW
jgi:hypothetical protein